MLLILLTLLTNHVNLRTEISMISAYAPVAQLDRALDFESRGRGFESYPVRHFPYFFLINTMITVAWTIYRDRFWDHLVRFCEKASGVDCIVT